MADTMIGATPGTSGNAIVVKLMNMSGASREDAALAFKMSGGDEDKALKMLIGGGMTRSAPANSSTGGRKTRKSTRRLVDDDDDMAAPIKPPARGAKGEKIAKPAAARKSKDGKGTGSEKYAESINEKQPAPPVSSLLMSVSNSTARNSVVRGSRFPASSRGGGRASHPMPPRSSEIPGAVAIDGAEASLMGDDEFTLTPPESSSAPANNTPGSASHPHGTPVTARLVDNFEDVENLQEELRQRDEQLEKIRRDQENIVVGQVLLDEVEPNEEDSDKPFFVSLCGSKRNAMIFAITLVLVVVGIVVGVVVALTSSSTPPQEDSPTATTPQTASPTAAPTSPLPNLIDLLSSVSFDGGTALQTASTPQNNAVLWLANNTHLDIYSDEKKIQRYVLATLYYSTNGPGWFSNTGWLSDFDECGWWNDADDGPFCYNGKVVKLDFYDRDAERGNNLVGTIPNEIALLSNSIDLIPFGDNRLTGQIPSEIGLLTKLTALWLWGNRLTGRIPSELASLTNLEYLSLTDNSFTGEFTCPTFIANCWVS